MGNSLIRLEKRRCRQDMGSEVPAVSKKGQVPVGGGSRPGGMKFRRTRLRGLICVGAFREPSRLRERSGSSSSVHKGVAHGAGPSTRHVQRRALATGGSRATQLVHGNRNGCRRRCSRSLQSTVVSDQTVSSGYGD